MQLHCWAAPHDMQVDATKCAAVKAHQSAPAWPVRHAFSCTSYMQRPCCLPSPRRRWLLGACARAQAAPANAGMRSGHGRCCGRQPGVMARAISRVQASSGGRSTWRGAAACARHAADNTARPALWGLRPGAFFATPGRIFYAGMPGAERRAAAESDPTQMPRVLAVVQPPLVLPGVDTAAALHCLARCGQSWQQVYEGAPKAASQAARRSCSQC